MISPTFLQILDSRGNPTLKASILIENTPLWVAVPSGASTGVHEALELRDGGTTWNGKGVLQALRNAQKLSSELDWSSITFTDADQAAQRLDGTPNKSTLGANAILAVSMLATRVQAYYATIQLWKLLSQESESKPILPTPFANVINGGEHAGNKLMPQEFMIVPHKATSFSEATRQITETVHALKKIIADEFGKSQTAVGDEGGFAPNIDSAHQACELLMKAMDASGHDLAIAMDAAASEFYADGKYEFEEGKFFSIHELAAEYVSLCKKFPIISLEDPFDEEDFNGFSHLREQFIQEGIACQVVGDDLTVTNVKRITLAAENNACDCLLLKINQIGTISESIAAAQLSKKYGWNVMVSHRSGETEDTFIADLCVGLGTGQIKLGAPVRGERTAKYNRLLEIEAQSDLAFCTGANISL